MTHDQDQEKKNSREEIPDQLIVSFLGKPGENSFATCKSESQVVYKTNYVAINNSLNLQSIINFNSRGFVQSIWIERVHPPAPYDFCICVTGWAPQGLSPPGYN